jgi:hypothetical protein
MRIKLTSIPFIFFVILAVAGTSHAAVTLVGSPVLSAPASCQGVSTCTTPTFGSNTTAGNTLAVCAMWVNSSGSTNSLSSTSGQNAATPQANTLSNTGATTNYTDVGGECAYATNITGGSTTGVTCNLAGTTSFMVCEAWQLTPAAAVPTGEQASATGSHAAGTVPTSAGTVTSGFNGAIVYSVIDNSFGGTGWSAGTSFTLGMNAGRSSAELGTETWAQTSAGSIAGAMSNANGSGTTNKWGSGIIVFEASSGGGGGGSFGGKSVIGGVDGVG